MKIVTRTIPPRSAWALEQAGIHPLLARLYAARGVQTREELDDGLARLLAPDGLHGARDAAVLLADAIRDDKRLCIVADYDCDGATACAVALRGLRLLGARHVSYLVPDRVIDGYGLTPPIAERVAATGADVLITVDNGIASVEGVAAAKARGKPPCSWPTPSPRTSACASWPTTTATAPPPARSACAACACWARVTSTTWCPTAWRTATASRP